MKLPLNTILLIAVSVLLTLQISSMFRSNKPNSYYKEKLADKEAEIKEVKQDRDLYRTKTDSLLALLRQSDTVLIREYKTNTIKYEKISPTVDAFNNDELRRAIFNY